MAKPELSDETDPLARFTTLQRYTVCEGGITAPHLIDVEHFDLDKAAPEVIASQCSEPSAMLAAVTVRKMIPDEVVRMTKEAAIYVISTPDHNMAKVGVSNNPIGRVKQLQTACPIQLKLHSLFWIVSGEPVGYERTIHKVASEMGYRVKREWIEATPAQTAFLAATILHKSGAKIADSAMWVRQRELIRMYLRADEIEDGTYW